MNQGGRFPAKPPLIVAAVLWLASAAMPAPAADESAAPEVGCAHWIDGPAELAECQEGGQRLVDWMRWLWWELPPADPPTEASVIYRQSAAFSLATTLHFAGYAPPPDDMAKLNERWARFERIKEIDYDAAMTYFEKLTSGRERERIFQEGLEGSQDQP